LCVLKQTCCSKDNAIFSSPSFSSCGIFLSNQIANIQDWDILKHERSKAIAPPAYCDVLAEQSLGKKNMFGRT
jgi:hypothetical protein